MQIIEKVISAEEQASCIKGKADDSLDAGVQTMLWDGNIEYKLCTCPHDCLDIIYLVQYKIPVSEFLDFNVLSTAQGHISNFYGNEVIS